MTLCFLSRNCSYGTQENHSFHVAYNLKNQGPIKIIKNYLNLCSLSCWIFLILPLCVCWRRDEQPREDARCEMWDAPRSWLIAPKMHSLHCLHPSAHLQMHCCLWCTAMHPHSKVFLCFKMRERFLSLILCLFNSACLPPPPMVVSLSPSPPIALLWFPPPPSPLSPQSPLPSLSPVSSLSMLSHIILQHSEPCHTLCPIQSYHCHTCHFYHPLKPLPTLLHLPSIINFPFATDFEYYSRDAQKGGSRRCTCGKKNNTAHLNSTRGSQETQQCLFFVLKL